MSDAALRQFSRQAATGDTEARVRLLRARVRAGERSGIQCEECDEGQVAWPAHLNRPGWTKACPGCRGTGYRPLRDGLNLAAYLGDAAIRALIKCPKPHATAGTAMIYWEGFHYEEQFQDHRELSDFASGLTRWGQETCVRAAVAAAREAFKLRQAACMASQNTLDCSCGEMRRAIDAAEAHIVDQSEENKDAWERATRESIPDWMVCSDDSVDAVRIRIERAAHLTTEPCVRTAIQRELVPWALGEDDTVLRRVNERRGHE